MDNKISNIIDDIIKEIDSHLSSNSHGPVILNLSINDIRKIIEKHLKKRNIFSKIIFGR